MEVRVICGSLGDLMSFIEDEMGKEIKAMMETMEKENTAEEKNKDADQIKECCASNQAEIPQTPWGKKEQASSAPVEDIEETNKTLKKQNAHLVGRLNEARDEITKLCVEKADLKSRIRSLEDYAMRVERITATSPLDKERCAQQAPLTPPDNGMSYNTNETAPRTI